MVVNHTSVGALCAIPFQSTYNASKAAMATFSRTLRMELAPLGVTVVEIRTGGVISNFLENKNDEGKGAMLPEGSVYEPAKEEAEEILRGKFYKERMEPAEKWADGVVKDLLSKKPPSTIWRGAGAGMAKYTTFLPDECMDGLMRQISKFDAVEKVLRG